MHEGRWPEDFLLGSPGFCRRRRAGRPQRSEDRIGPATSGGGRRPHLTGGRKVLTNCYRVLTICAQATRGLAGSAHLAGGVSLDRRKESSHQLLSRAHDLRSGDPWFGWVSSSRGWGLTCGRDGWPRHDAGGLGHISAAERGAPLGIVGALVAIPAAAALLLLTREVLFPRLDHT